MSNGTKILTGYTVNLFVDMAKDYVLLKNSKGEVVYEGTTGDCPVSPDDGPWRDFPGVKVVMRKEEAELLGNPEQFASYIHIMPAVTVDELREQLPPEEFKVLFPNN